MGGSRRQPTGWKYSMGIHMGVARGPLDELVEIRAGGRTAWSRDADGPVTASGRTTIYCPDLFGGDEKEGGLDGTLDVMMGESTQVPPSSLATVMPGLIPGFRDVTTLFYDGQISANNPYPKTWEIRGRRTTSGWQDNAPWYPEKATVWLGSGDGLNGIKAMNGAHIIYELNTNRSWGRGLPAGRIDVDSFTAAANTLYAEGFGLCLPWLRQESLADFQQRVLDHIGGACGPDPHTGKMRLRLIRDDYDPEALPLFTYGSGLLDVVQEEAGAVHESINEIIVGWFDPVSGQARQTAPIQNLASIQSIGIRNTSIRDYSGCPTAELASRLAQRDLRAASPSLKRFKIRLDRRAYWLQPGDVFRISAPDRGIGNVVLRAGDVREDWITDGTITVVALIDVFGLPATATVSAQPSLHVRPDYTPAPALYRKLMEAPYQQLVQQFDPANLELVSPLDGFVMACAVRPTAQAWSFRLLTRTAGADYQERGTGYWCPTGITTVEYGPGANSLVLTDVIDLDAVVVGDAALWEDEIVRVDAIDHSTRTVTVGRGCADTVPVLHLAGSRIWFFDGPAGVDPTTWLAGELVDVKLLTTTGAGRLTEADAPTNSITLGRRHSRPYPPAAVTLDGGAYPAACYGNNLLVTWAHRDRLQQADQLVDTLQGSMGPEEGTTYEWRLLRADTMAVIGSGDTPGASAVVSGTYRGQVRLELWSVCDSLSSWQRHEINFSWYGLELIAEDDSFVISETGVQIVMEV